MSHANGEVWSLGGVMLGYFEYNGTVDVCIPRIYRTYEGLRENWRGENNWRQCSCSQQPVEVILYTDYGYGFYWQGKACLQCMAITEGIGKYDIERDGDGHPFPERQPNLDGVS